MLTVRPAQLPDSEGIYQIANHPKIRLLSFKTESFTYEEHQRWFTSALDNPTLLILVGMRETELVGYLRFKKEKSNATLSVALHPDQIARGLGTALLEESLRLLKKKWPETKAVKAIVKENNLRSQKFFEKNGFLEKETYMYHKADVKEYRYEL